TAMDIRSKIALADDYIVKPFLFANLLYRIMMMLRLSVPARAVLVDQALRLPCYEPSHPFSGQPSFHHIAEKLPAYTACQGWAALEINLVNYHDLARTYGWPLVYTFISRISQAINRIVGPDLLVGHTGFDSAIVIVGPTVQIIQVERLLAPYFANFSQYCLGLSQLLTVQISLRHADDRAGLALSLPALRAALH
ncbi:MAG: hypothetical protein HGA19_07970, partial [Oscillochloris sp.]|nr:hypothetical protein [Oscillochloris sp.]